MKTLLLSCLLAFVSLPSLTPSQQDQTFRLLNLERRCDQLQIRLEILERQQQNQAFNVAPDPNREIILEFQRQLLALNQQLLTQQAQQLELKKAFDQQTTRLQELEKRTVVPANENKPASENKAAPKPTPRRP